MTSDTTEDLRIGPEILKQQAELYRRLRNTLRWLLGSLDGFTEAERVADGGHAGAGALGAAPADRARRVACARRWRATTGPACYPELHDFCAGRPVGVLFRYPQGRAVLRPAGQPAPARRAHRAGPSASLPDHLAGAGPVLHRRGGLVRPLRRRRQRASAHVPGAAGGVARSALAREWETIRAIRRRITVPLEDMRARRARSAPRCRPRSILPLSAGHADLLNDDDWAEVAIVSIVTHRCGRRRSRHATIAHGPGREMRPLLARAGGSRHAGGASGAVPALRRRGRIRPGRASAAS